MIERLPAAAVMTLVVLATPSPKTGCEAVLVEVLSRGGDPIEATKLAIFPSQLACDKHLSDLADASPLIESRAALTERRIHYAQTLRCFPSRALWTYWRRRHCLDGGTCV
jgi:hypothetical protein